MSKGVADYIASCPKNVQQSLRAVRAAIQAAAPGATERTDYFDMPGYSYAGYDYDGMFAWFSFKSPFIRLHVRPPVLEDHQKDVAGYKTTKAIVSFPMDETISPRLIQKLVKASIKVMKAKAK
jgi:uncharacterized protein YdhG (YjbR/CyaY superfamily)